MLPEYISKAVPNPASNRAPWYVNTAPSYAGIFLWIGFYQAHRARDDGARGPLLCLVALAVAGLLSYALYYYIPAMLGMGTGYPLYVMGSSTFGDYRRIPDARSADGPAANGMARGGYLLSTTPSS